MISLRSGWLADQGWNPGHNMRNKDPHHLISGRIVVIRNHNPSCAEANLSTHLLPKGCPLTHCYEAGIASCKGDGSRRLGFGIAVPAPETGDEPAAQARVSGGWGFLRAAVRLSGLGWRAMRTLTCSAEKTSWMGRTRTLSRTPSSCRMCV